MSTSIEEKEASYSRVLLHWSIAQAEWFWPQLTRLDRYLLVLTSN